MKNLLTCLICLICLTVPLFAFADMVSFDQYVFDRSSVTCSFQKSQAGFIKFNMIYGAGLGAKQASYICDQKYTNWKDMIKYSKKVANYLNKTEHIDPIEILTKIGLSNVRESK